MEMSVRTDFDARFAAAQEIANVIPARQRHTKSIKDVGKGGVIRLDGEVFVVKETATYTETKGDYTPKSAGKAYVSTELVLFSLRTGETRFIEWGVDDVLEVSFTERKIPNRELRGRLKYDDDEAVYLSDADEIVKQKWDLIFNRQTYSYEDDWPCLFSSTDGREYFAYMYEFEDEDSHQLTIEAWSDDGDENGDWDYEVYLSRGIPPTEVEVISTGNKQE